MDPRQKSYAVRPLGSSSTMTREGGWNYVHERRIETNHVDLSEDSERDLFDGRGLSPSEDVALEEEERVVMGGGRLPRFLNLHSSKLRFLCRISSCFFFSRLSRLSLLNRSRKDPSFENTFTFGILGLGVVIGREGENETVVAGG